MKSKNKKKNPKYNRLDSLLWALKWHWREDRKFVFLLFAMVPVTVVSPLLSSYFSKVLIDQIGAGAEFGKLALVCICFLAAIFGLEHLQNWIDSGCQSRAYYMTQIVQTKLGSMQSHLTDFENLEKDEFNERLEYAYDDACHGNCSVEYVWNNIVGSLVHILGIITCASLLASVNPIIFLIIVATSILSYFTSRWQHVYGESHKHLWQKENRKKHYIQGLSDNFPAAKDIKLYGMERWLESLMRQYQDFVFMWDKKCNLRGAWASILSGVLTLVVQDGAAYVFLVIQLLAGKIGVGDFVFYFGIVGSIASYLGNIVGDVVGLRERADKIAYYREVFDFPNSFNHGQGCKLPEGEVKIEFKNVCYRYPGAEKDTLKNINLTFAPGESLALVGMNGAGKTTLVKLLCGMYSPTSGEILVDGKSIQEYNIDEYYSLISAVFQKFKIMPFTILEFIASAAPDRPTAREDAEKALRLAGLWEKVESLENGIDNHLVKGIFDDGVELSGGETQKLMLARAIYKDGRILVLDEPTAALDPIAENKLYMQYRELTKGKTSLYISHRFASTRFCDRIVLLEDGVITETGTHDELMAQKGQYAYMFGVQSKYYKEGEVNA